MSKTVNGLLYFTYQEVADKLGFTYGTIGTMVSRGTFNSVKFTKDSKKYISVDQIENYLNPDKSRSSVAVETAESEVPQGTPFHQKPHQDTSVQLAAIQAIHDTMLVARQALTLLEKYQLTA